MGRKARGGRRQAGAGKVFPGAGDGDGLAGMLQFGDAVFVDDDAEWLQGGAEPDVVGAVEGRAEEGLGDGVDGVDVAFDAGEGGEFFGGGRGDFFDERFVGGGDGIWAGLVAGMKDWCRRQRRRRRRGGCCGSRIH